MSSNSKMAGPVKGSGPVENKGPSSLSRGLSSLRKADWTTFGALAIIVLLGAYLRFYFDFWQSIAGGFPSLSGGSDADFYFNVLSYALTTGHQMLYDSMLNYPIGSYNPFLPFYVWTNVLLSYPLAFLLHIPVTGSIYSGQLTAGVIAYASMSAISGVIAIIITYYIGKEMFSKEAGIIGAALMAFLPSIVSESTVGFGVHDPFVLMLTALFFFFLFRSLNTINGTKWVERWIRKDSFLPDFQAVAAGVTRYYRDNKVSMLYAGMAGITLASIANAWEGFEYILAIVAFFYLVQSFIYKFKNRDTLALTAIFTIVGGLLSVMSLPVYYNSNAVYPWYYVSLVFFIGTLVVGVIYTVARDVPWLTLITALVAAVLIVVGVGEIADRPFLHGILVKVLNAQSYFIKSAVYTTIAEAQTPPFSLLALSLGGAVFFIAFAELAYMVYRSPRGISNSKMLLIIWFVISTFMAVSTVRFVLDATTTFVIFAGEGIFALVSWTNFGEIRKGLQTYGSDFSGVRKSIKVKHLLVVIFVAFVIVMPVVWTGLDAATPSTSKTSLNTQVYDLLPGFLRPAGYIDNSSASPYYFGAFGYSLETPSTYFPAAWAFINNRSVNIVPYSSRPAYLSWWDYGSEVITFANTPTVADDFQQGYQLASAFLFSQNQTQAVSLLVARILDGAFATNGNSLPQNLSAALTSAGINATYVARVFADPGSFTNLVLQNPDIYGPFASTVTASNVKYAVLMVTISKIGLNNVVNLYQRVSQLTGKFIGIISVDARLFPFSATNTGVFYAPAFLGGRPIAGPGVYNIPYNYYTITALTSTGISYPLESIPAGSTVLSYNLNYQPMFYNMTMYRFFMGYSAYDITGQNLSGLPGLSGSFLSNSQLSGLQPLPGWMTSHFEMIYRTAYYNPYPIQYVRAHPNAWQAISYKEGLKLANADPTFSNYTVDLSPQSDFENGIVVMEYYPGAYVNGTVLTGTGQPAAGVRVTVLDQWGIPHDVVYTNQQGKYSAIALQGNDKIVFSTGPLTNAGENLTQIGTILNGKSINVSYAQAMRETSLNTTTGLPAYDIQMGVMKLSPTSVTGHIFFTTPTNSTFTPGVTRPVLNITVEMQNSTTGLTYTTWAADGLYNITSMLPGTYNVYLLSGNSRILVFPNMSVVYGIANQQDLAVNPYYVVGAVRTASGIPVAGVGVKLAGSTNNFTYAATTLPNGTYSFAPLLPGNYTVQAYSGGYVSNSYTVGAVTLNYTQTHPKYVITAMKERTLTGEVTIGGAPVVNDTLYFYSKSEGVLPFRAMTGASGAYSLTIGAGNYTVYSVYYDGSQPYVALSAIEVGGTGPASANFSLVGAYSVSGVVLQSSDGFPVPYANVNIYDGAAVLNFTANSNGQVSILLPDGTYGVWTYGGSEAYIGQFTVSGGATSLQLPSSPAKLYAGEVNTNISGTLTGVSSAALSFAYNGITYSSYTNTSGYFSLTLPQSLSTTVHVSAFGMQQNNVTFSSSTAGNRQIELLPALVAFSGSVTGGAQLPAGTTLELTAANGTSKAIPVYQGAYSAMLSPGTYNVVLAGYNSSSVRYTLSGTQSSVTLPIGQSTVFNAAVVPKYNTTFYFNYPVSSGTSNQSALSRLDIFSTVLQQPVAIDNFLNGGSIYLQAANYTVYSYSAVNGNAFSFISRLQVSGKASYVLNLGYVSNLTGTVYYGNLTLGSATVYVRAANGAQVQAAVQSDGTFALSLPSSTYTITASYSSTENISGQLRYVSYRAQTTVNLTATVNVNLQTSVSNYNSTLSGTAAWFYGLPVQSQIKFIPHGQTAIAADLVTAGDGSFAASIAPGNYTVETYSSSGVASNITALTVLPGQNGTFNPVLEYAYRVQGNVSVPGLGSVAADVTFKGSGGSFSITSGAGGYSLLLPGGNYTVFANYSMTSQGTVYPYSFESHVQVSAPAVMPLVLSLVPTYSVRLTVLSTQLSQGASGFTQVSLLVNNTGDQPDLFYMSVLTSNWYGAFTPTYVALGTGDNSSAVVNATLSSTNPAGGFNSVAFNAYSLISSRASASASASVRVPTYYGFSATFSSYGAEKVGRTITFTVVVNNTGNTNANYVASVSNLAGLRAEGWSGGIYTTTYGPFQNSTLFSLTSHQNQTLTISLTATVPNPSTALPVGINITQKATGSSYSLSVPINLPNPVVSLNGIAVSGHGASASPPPLISFRRATVIFVLAALIVANVYYAKKRRLIR